MDPQDASHLVFTSLLLAAIVFASCQSQIDSMREEFNLRVHRSASMLSDTRTGSWRLDKLSETGRLVFAVEFDFEEGDHAAPGTYEQQHFVEILK